MEAPTPPALHGAAAHVAAPNGSSHGAHGAGPHRLAPVDAAVIDRVNAAIEEVRQGRMPEALCPGRMPTPNAPPPGRTAGSATKSPSGTKSAALRRSCAVPVPEPSATVG